MLIQKKVHGFTLLEVVISLSLMAILLLGFEAVQASVIKQAHQSQGADQTREMAASSVAYQFAHAHDMPTTLPTAWQSAIGSTECNPIPV